MLNCIAHSRAGSANYYAAHQRGTIDIWHDSQRWVYRHGPTKLRAFKLDIIGAFSNPRCGEDVRISGRYPSYTVD
jgi:hypothetical protein